MNFEMEHAEKLSTILITNLSNVCETSARKKIYCSGTLCAFSTKWNTIELMEIIWN